MLIHKCYLAKLNNTDLEVWGTGNALREFIYSEDVGRLTRWVLNNYDEVEPIILSPSTEISIREMVDLIVENLNFKGNISVIFVTINILQNNFFYGMVQFNLSCTTIYK